MGESHSPAIVRDNVRDLLLAEALLDHLAELVGGFLIVDLVGLESSPSVIENSEIFICSFNRDNVHLSEGESVITSDLSVHLNKTGLVLHDLAGLVAVHGVLQSLLEQHIQGDALSKLMRSRGGSGCVHTLKFSKVPLLGSGDSFQDLSLAFIALNENKCKKECFGR